jgi:cephalosporin hydroxylase
MREYDGEPIEQRLAEPLGRYWLDRVRAHWSDTYMGVPISKFPEDLRMYEHLIWRSRPNVVVEFGCQYGGSALWFRDRLEALSRYAPAGPPKIVSVDVFLGDARPRLEAADPGYAATISLVEGDVRDPAVVQRVMEEVPPGSRCLVVDDSAHTYETTTAGLEAFASLVPTGGYFVVEDGCVDIEPMRLEDHWPRGVLPAIADWLATAEGSRFRVRRDLELYALTCHPGGILERVA